MNPIIADRFRASVIIPSLSGIPKDSCVNTFGFRNDGAFTRAQIGDKILDRLADFYNAVVAQTGSTVGSILNGSLMGNAAKVKIYDLGEAPPRTVDERDLTLALSAGGAMPTEVAITCSFYGDRNLPRQRGRLFIGPVKSTAFEVVAGRVEVNDSTRTTLAHAMRRLAQDSITNGASWHVISPTAASSVEVTAGWVDNTADTQRRRGTEASFRHTWDSAGVAEVAEQ